MKTSKPKKSVAEFEVELEQMTRELTDLERGLAARRAELIRAHKAIELIKKIRELRKSPTMLEVEELAQEVGL